MDASKLSQDRDRLLLTAIAERLIPSCDGPGAVEAGVPAYVERALDELSLRRHRPLIDYGLELVDHLALEANGKPFVECTPAEQDAVLGRVQSSEEAADRLFFRRLQALCLEGFLCHPNRGGNLQGLAWEYLGYQPGPTASEKNPTA